MLEKWSIHFRHGLDSERLLFDVAHHANHCDPVAFAFEAGVDALAERVLVRPIFSRERGVDDRNFVAGFVIAFGEDAAA